jgi:hypothetical protein
MHLFLPFPHPEGASSLSSLPSTFHLLPLFSPLSPFLFLCPFSLALSFLSPFHFPHSLLCFSISLSLSSRFLFSTASAKIVAESLIYQSKINTVSSSTPHPHARGPCISAAASLPLPLPRARAPSLSSSLSLSDKALSLVLTDLQSHLDCQ